MPETKRCSKCGAEKPLTEFFANKYSADGLQHYCKDCQRRYQRELYQRHKSLGNWGGSRKYNDPNNPLCIYTDRHLMLELRRRGWYGSLKKLVETNITEL